MGTVHSVGSRLLRRYMQLRETGRDSGLTIMDSADQEGIVKQLLKQCKFTDKSNKPSAILSAMSNDKSSMGGTEDFVPTSWKDEIIASVYTGYEAALRENNAVDFDDLLVLAVQLLDKSPEIV